MLGRNQHLIIGILATFKTGATYVPIDPLYLVAASILFSKIVVVTPVLRRVILSLNYLKI